VPSQHAAHIIKIDRDVGQHNDGRRISVLSTKTGSGEQNNRQHHQDDDAGRIDGQYEEVVIHLLLPFHFGTKLPKNQQTELFFDDFSLSISLKARVEYT